ncbi:type II toxin-antitoxin system PemK/MazF family toxin [Ligilactobacillus agilis]|nr:type II toxin-antitoxin system PemK/MazF family toxin [Ligilactobacillus agilis]
MRKRRPALVISNSRYSSLTGLALICLITHALSNGGEITESCR